MTYSILENYLKSKGDFTNNDVNYITNHFKLKKVKKKEIIIDFNQVSNAFYFVNKGALRIFTINKKGVELTRFFTFENSFCTALPSFIDQKPACEYFQAIEPSELLEITRNDFYKLVDQYSDFDKIYREILERSFINNQKRIYSFQGYAAIDKLKLLLETYPDFLIRVPNNLTASYLGISPSTLSRLKSKL
ncbi:Crp/Fnr family transcriptional regulator [Zhouia amylolytica]|uniref:cAMP-binding protein n=1 Tax=Zhouia amylolytica AD3 TaxID=1286632 RepID=W2UP94_9FLAO|nr:Crp/Fnr family transcriptional regulator [Zhouia amylolytica]ETN95286.1 cAMP-binding protein [Zhouia amylolytica AD3]